VIRYTATILAFTGLWACEPKPPTPPNQNVLEDAGGDDDFQGPGSEVWGDSDVSCETQDDCLVGESCLQNVCQPSQCQGGLAESMAPLGTTFEFFADNEIGVADQQSWSGAYYIDSYEPSLIGTEYTGSWEIGSSRLHDITGGRFDKLGNAEWAAAVDGRNSLAFTKGDSVEWISLGFMPEAIDAGDTDGDGLDEVVVVSEDGLVAICHMDRMTCEQMSFEDGVSLRDVAVGDVDGDAVAEIAILLEFDGEDYIYVVNQDHEDKGQPETYQAWVGEMARIAIGDLNGDRVAEIVTFKDVNEWPIVSEDDEITVWNIAASVTDDDMGDVTALLTITVTDLTEVQDIDVADTDADQIDELYLIDIDGTVSAFDLRDEAGLILRHQTQMSTTIEPYRIAMADTDGNSPRATLIDGPQLCKGAPVPGALVLMPPYDQDHSAGPAGSFYGSGESVSEDLWDTMYMSLSMDIGVNADFTAIFSATLNEKVSWRTSKVHIDSKRKYVGGRFGMTADPESYGPYHGAVVLHWGCFDAYTYEIEDPHDLIGGGDSEKFVLTVPVGGSVSVWSVARYNAMAEELGTLPVIDVPYAVGVVEDYPAEPETIFGEEIHDDDIVFPDEEWYVAPDVGSISFWRSVESSETNRTSLETSLGLSASITVAGVKVGGGVDMGWGQGYSMRVGEAALFAGSVQAVPDIPDTPEDEYELYTYRFAPVVYRQWYEGADGADSAFYVMTYVAER
jgi:hypothetical protein